MRSTLLLTIAAILVSALWVRADAPAVPASRAAFLKLIDRPRVDSNVEEKPMPTPPAGMVQSHLAFSSEAGQRVPAIVLKPDGAAGRLPVVIVLHGTGGKKEGNLGLMKTLVG